MEKMRNPYVYGSAAPKIEYDLYETNRVLKYKKTQRSVKKQKSKLVYIILMLFILSAIVIFRYSQITELNYAIGINRVELSKLEKENDSLQSLIDKNTDLEEIKNIAINQLNMRQPYKHQLEYVKIDKKDYTVAINKYSIPSLPEANIITLLIKNLGRSVNIFK